MDDFFGVKTEVQKVMQICVAGVPHAQTRARHVIKNGKSIVYSNATQGIKLWKLKLRRELSAAFKALELNALEGALCVDMLFMIPIKDKKRHYQLSYTKPDKDSLEKACLDIMESVGFFLKGDSQVAAGEVMKMYVPHGASGVKVQLSRIRIKKAPSVGAEGKVGIDWLSP